MTPLFISIVIFILVVLLPIIFLFITFLSLWLEASSNKLHVSFLQLFHIHLRGLNSKEIVKLMISLNKGGVKVSIEELQTHKLAGGHLYDVVGASVQVKQAGIDMNFKDICAIDLAGRNVNDAVKSFIEPKIIYCPEKGAPSEFFIGVAQDGIRLAIKLRVTVRSNMKKLIGGAGEKTIIARVGEVVIKTIGQAKLHSDILKQPDLISENILSFGIDSQTAWEIVSIDVADVDVMDNLGAKLNSMQASADKDIADAKAESRRAEAVAKTREMKAKVRYMQSQLVLVKSMLPNAMASAFYEGNIGIKKRPCPTVFNTTKWG